jgi:hypothetical protein
MSEYNNNNDLMNRLRRPQNPRNAVVKDIAIVSQRRDGIKKMIGTLEARIKSLEKYQTYEPVVSTNNTPNSSRVVMDSFTRQSKEFAGKEIISLDQVIQGYQTQLNNLPRVYSKIIGPKEKGKPRRRIKVVSYTDPSKPMRRGLFG